MSFFRSTLYVFLLLVILLSKLPAQAAEYVDVLDLPAMKSELSKRYTLNAITNTGTRIVTVGERGHILYSDNSAKTWQQASVPVSSDLTAVYFPTPSEGWAVGHDGVVLHSSDRGQTWVKQLDGIQIGPIMLRYYKELAARDTENPQWAHWIDQSQRMVDDGADKPFLGVWFANSTTGYIVGAFGMAFRTEDGGKTWVPIGDKIDNPDTLHLNAIDGTGSEIVIVGEQGLLLELDAAAGRFVAAGSPSDVTYFGVLHAENVFIIFGLNGKAFKKTKLTQNWLPLNLIAEIGPEQAKNCHPHCIPAPVETTLTAVTQDASGVFYIADVTGSIFRSDDGENFQEIPRGKRTLLITDITTTNDGQVVSVGLRGAHVLSAN